ncbi:hypothetical protein J6590_027765 [Homalodisca vitripennis]|nr:hypothetical protein J6590_027765 [Homalodisca vitripennis]
MKAGLEAARPMAEEGGRGGGGTPPSGLQRVVLRPRGAGGNLGKANHREKWSREPTHFLSGSVCENLTEKFSNYSSFSDNCCSPVIIVLVTSDH